ncbi:unnamed protein product [Allacma fusca]|uniref:TATA-box-binding protein n=1 Tax=Allacma fusca TaxID=39272 RepID=A0A8J2Q236_9HEXA|nr:unnamed protein product [Allacma fusca]
MDNMLPSPGFNIPSIGTPLHQPEEDLILPSAQQHQQSLANSSSGPASVGLGGVISSFHTGMTPQAHGLTPQHHGLTPQHHGLTPQHHGMTPQPHSLMQPQTPSNFSPAIGAPSLSGLTQPMSVHQPLSMSLYGGPTTPAPMTPMTPSSADPGIVPQLQNIVSTVNLGCKLDLKKIALHARNAEYNPKRFAAVIMRIREPRTTALIFSSGKMVCTGAKSEEDSRLAARNCDVKFPIRLEGLVLTHSQFSSYEPELFPGLIYRMVKPRIVLLIFVSGKVVLTGAKVRQEIYEAFDNIYPILKSFKKQ